MSRLTIIGAGFGAMACALAVAGLSPSAFAAGDLAAAKTVVEAHSALPTFVPPGEPFDAKKVMAGKKILTIPVSSANPFTKNITLAMIAVAKEVGFVVAEWENQARPTQWVQGMEYAINNKFDAIDMLGGVDPAVLGPQIQEAKKAGVKIFVSHLYDTIIPPDPSVDLSLPIPYHSVGDILAAWVATKTQGKENVLIIGSEEIVPTKAFV
jgi:ribose transport system substrate-binding protein